MVRELLRESTNRNRSVMTDTRGQALKLIVGALGVVAVVLFIALLLAIVAALGGVIGASVAVVYNIVLGTSLDPVFFAAIGSLVGLPGFGAAAGANNE